YQLEIGYLADESSCRDALEADAKYRRSISKRVMSGIPLWSCFTEDAYLRPQGGKRIEVLQLLPGVIRVKDTVKALEKALAKQ
ncbi:hypothetical protein Pmar_PMAR028341, partial [Perkinsus marinus ATCC 50983]